MKSNQLILLSFVFFPFIVKSQEKPSPVAFVSIFNNATAMPFSGKLGIIHSPVHPGLSVGYSAHLNNSNNNQLFQNFRLGYFFHRFAQHGIQLYTETGFRKQLSFGLGLEARVGAGYLHSIPHTQIFTLDEDGEYQKKSNFGRPQAMVSIAFGPSYDLKNAGIPGRIFLDYQVWFQYPFVNQYIPLLPNISFHLGYAFIITGKGDSNEK